MKRTQESVLKEIKSTRGRLFNVKFKKKDGTIRSMTCRLGVHKYVNGKGMSYDPMMRGLLTVFDVHKNGYRHINLSTVTELMGDPVQIATPIKN